MSRPDRPLADDPGRRDVDPAGDDDRRADLQEREEGANQEKVGDDANLRADPTPPGEDPSDPQVARAHGEEPRDGS